MSGGYFDYNQYRINDIVDQIEKLIQKSNNKDEYHSYSDKTIYEFKVGIELLKKAEIYAHRIDWLVSGDDSEEAFHKRLKNELLAIKIEKSYED